MGLGSQDDKTRKTFKKEVAGKINWKDDVKSPNEAYTMITQIKKNLEKDPNRDYLLEAYCGKQIRLLQEYMKEGNGMTLKEYCAKTKN